MDWTVEKTKSKKVGKERRKNSKPKQEQGKLKPRMVPIVANEKKQWVRKLREGLTRLPLMTAEFLEGFSFSWASPPFLFFTAHYSSYSHSIVCGVVPPHARAWRSDSRVPWGPMAPGNPMESIR